MGTIIVNGWAIYDTPEGKYRMRDKDGNELQFSDFDEAADFADRLPAGDEHKLIEAVRLPRR